MATLRDILRKIGAVKKTRQITRAMNMVAAAKLRNTQGRMERFEPYAGKFLEVLENLASRIDPEVHPLLVSKEEVSRVELIHFTSDRGLSAPLVAPTSTDHASGESAVHLAKSPFFTSDSAPTSGANTISGKSTANEDAARTVNRNLIFLVPSRSRSALP